MNRPQLRTLIVIGSLTALTAAGCASSMKIGSGDIVADRQRLMKLNGGSWADAQAKFKAGNIEGIAVNAETMALNAAHIPMLFPEGSLTDKSKAKPEVWQKWDDFVKASKNFEEWAGKLRDTARSKNAQATEVVMKEFGAKACGTCHQPFRVPPPRPPAAPAR
ncbi:MAG: cytochrome c [Candidatus Rokubacteria bacterium]|nr:cytochrome c [Candidatus Rokubacteria bacterium]MBI4592848.1 cytochrome c [Candidatus Rokubacteria bacterium]